MSVHFQISSPIFWGFNRVIDIHQYKTFDECVNAFLDVHEQFLFENNYVDLLNFFKKVRSDYHVHCHGNNNTIEELKNAKDIVYVCRHPANPNEQQQFLK